MVRIAEDPARVFTDAGNNMAAEALGEIHAARRTYADHGFDLHYSRSRAPAALRLDSGSEHPGSGLVGSRVSPWRAVGNVAGAAGVLGHICLGRPRKRSSVRCLRLVLER